MLKPPRLKKGDTVGIIAPSYRAKPEHINKSAETLRSLGFKVKYSKYLFSITNGYAGSVEERAEDFNAMINDDEVKMLFFGGGEVCNEILPFVDYENIKRHPKIIASYSDSTTILNAIHQMSDIVTFYGMAPGSFEDLTDYNRECFERRFMSTDTEYVKNSEWVTLRPGKAEGILIGGYLENFAALMGLEQYPKMPEEDYILFIEDHEKFSPPSMVSKWFTNMEHRGVFGRARGLIWGHFSTNEYPVIDEILIRLGERYKIPVMRTDDYGHGINSAILPIGIKAVLDTDLGHIRFCESGVE